MSEANPFTEDPSVNRTVFKTTNVFSEQYQPDEIQGRDEEIDTYVSAFKSVYQGWNPENIFVYGKTGVGKTVVTRYIIDKLIDATEDNDDVDKITPVWLNCEGLNSTYKVAVNLVNKLRDKGNKISKTGHSKEDVYDHLFEELNKLGGTILIVLDEIDAIGNDDEILYKLSRAEDNNWLTNGTVGVVGISNDYQFRSQLSPKVKDTLCENEIKFSPYDAGELRTILSQRAELAFKDDVLEDDVIPYCAAKAAQNRGSARQGIDLLHAAGDLADDRGDSTVTEEHVRDAEDTITTRGRIEDVINELTSQNILALGTLAYFEHNGNTSVRAKEIYGRYKNIALQNDIDPLVEQRLRDQLNELDMLGFATKTLVNKGRRGGRYNEYESNVSYEAVQDATDKVI